LIESSQPLAEVEGLLYPPTSNENVYVATVTETVTSTQYLQVVMNRGQSLANRT